MTLRDLVSPFSTAGRANYSSAPGSHMCAPRARRTEIPAADLDGIGWLRHVINDPGTDVLQKDRAAA